MSIWSALPTLTEKFDWTGHFSLMESFINSIVVKGFMTQELGSFEFVQTAAMMMLIMSYAASAYVICATISAGVSVSRGFYHTYAGGSAIGNLLYLFELFLIIGWEFWGFMQVIFATSLASDAWGQLEARRAEAAQTIGFETPLEWTLAIKSSTLLMLVGVMMVVSGFSLGDIADEAITWVAEYDDDTKTEGDDKNDASNDDPDGTSATQDITLHMVTAVYGMFIFGIMSISSYIFAWNFLNIKDGGSELECQIKNYDYSAINSVVANISNYETCIENIDALFDIVDVNGDNYISRCEDANFQAGMGQEVGFAIKFSSAFTRQYATVVCNDYKL